MLQNALYLKLFPAVIRAIGMEVLVPLATHRAMPVLVQEKINALFVLEVFGLFLMEVAHLRVTFLLYKIKIRRKIISSVKVPVLHRLLGSLIIKHAEIRVHRT